MPRLDSLSKKEISRLYYLSLWLRIYGDLVLLGVALIFLLLLFVNPVAAAIFFLILLLPALLFVYGLYFVRTQAARIALGIFVGFSLIGSVLYIIAALIQTNLPAVLWAVLQFLLAFGILKSIECKMLWGGESFTHKQIAQARKRIKKEEHFSDEDFPRHQPCRVLSALFVILLYLLDFLLVAGTIAALVKAIRG